jgi:CRISPR system Cascade subunit CasD
MSSNLAMFFDGPMQAYGYMADHQYRTTLAHPTRSCITGLIAAAIGIDKNDPNERAQIDRLNTLHITTIRLESLENAEAEHRQPRLRDFQTARTWGSNGQVIGNMDLTLRDYLQDCKFVVLLEGTDVLLERIAAGLQSPRWMLSLGRRCCVPASPIFAGRFESETEAIEKISQRLGKPFKTTLRIEEVNWSEPGATLLRDKPISFAERIHGQRSIRIFQPSTAT